MEKKEINPNGMIIFTWVNTRCDVDWSFFLVQHWCRKTLVMLRFVQLWSWRANSDSGKYIMYTVYIFFSYFENLRALAISNSSLSLHSWVLPNSFLNLNHGMIAACACTVCLHCMFAMSPVLESISTVIPNAMFVYTYLPACLHTYVRVYVCTYVRMNAFPSFLPYLLPYFLAYFLTSLLPYFLTSLLPYFLTSLLA